MSEALDAWIVSEVARMYAAWAKAKTYGPAREPRVGVSLLTDLIRDLGYDEAERLTGSIHRPDQYQTVYAACARLVKAGKLESSIGLASNGREERQYNPAPGA